MRKPVTKTYDISLAVYSLLFHCCEKYYNNLAWKYPKQCPDGNVCCGFDEEQFASDLQYEIPTLFRDSANRIAVPTIHNNIFNDDKQDEYDQYALFDLIEFFAENIHDVIISEIHGYFSHHHLNFQNNRNVCVQFRNEINDIFKKTGMLYELNTNLQVERIVEINPLTPTVETILASVQEPGTCDLLKKAILLHKSPHPEDIQDATEKLWDAFERLKTYHSTMNKRDSAAKIVSDISGGQTDYYNLFDTEFKTLTTIGNNFRIRHHETDKVEITDTCYYDYFFNRCLSLMAIAIQYLK